MQAHPVDLLEGVTEILADLANYNDIVPVVQVSEAVVERSDR